MKFIRNHALSVTLFALALGVSATQANAGQGTFNLPFQARWSGYVLEPGEYQLSVPQTSASWPEKISLTGNGKTVWILASTEEERGTFDKSYLRLVNVGGTYTVSEFNSVASGKSFTFNLPKAASRLTSAQGKGVSVAIDDTQGK